MADGQTASENQSPHMALVRRGTARLRVPLGVGAVRCISRKAGVRRSIRKERQRRKWVGIRAALDLAAL